MINVSQLAAALYGTWLVLKLDPRGLAYFEKTPGGFARSFLVAGLLAPLQLAHAIMTYDPTRARLAILPFVVVQMLNYVLSWICFPFVMLYLTDWLQRRERYFWQMVPYNWIQLAIATPLLIFAIMADLHMLSAKLIAFLQIAALLVFFVYQTFLARVGLQIGLATAFGIVVLDLLMSQLLAQLIGRI
jgi:hypothetical protein